MGQPAPEVTLEYRAEELTERGAVAVVSKSSPTAATDLQSLLRRRLRFISVGFVLLYGMAVIVSLVRTPFANWTLDVWSYFATLLIVSLLAGFLWSQKPMALRVLRAIELVFVAIMALRLLFRGYSSFSSGLLQDHIRIWRETGRADLLTEQLHMVALYISVYAGLCMVAYGAIIPNTGRRCMLVVAVFWLIPPILWIAGCVGHDLPAAFWSGTGIPGTFTIFTLTGAAAIFGSHRIETLRTEALAAKRMGQYVVRERLGAGGMGEVYLADHVLLRRPCALKLIRPEKARDPAALERFEIEVRATATLTHPNAVQIFDYGHTQDGTFYYVMEYLPGPTLEQLVEKDGPLPVERAIHFLRQLCGALHEAHAIGLIHRDIKPGNVIVCERGRTTDVAKLLDFGLVQSVLPGGEFERSSQRGIVVGTPAYLSPEQASGASSVDARSDIYSLGALAYFLLTGHAPFAGRSVVQMIAAHRKEPAPSLAERRADLPERLQAIVLRCLAKDPAARFPDVRSLEAALAECLVAAPSEGSGR